MRQIMFVLQFRGTGTPGDGGKLIGKSQAGSSTITTSIGANGVGASIGPAAGESASFESEVTLTGESSFVESGSITFGAGNTLRFGTVGQGHLGAGGEEGITHGSVMWMVEGGSGQFSEATGLITSNFTLDSQGRLVDNQWGVVWVH